MCKGPEPGAEEGEMMEGGRKQMVQGLVGSGRTSDVLRVVGSLGRV